MRKLLALAACLLIGSTPAVGQTARRPLALEDHSRIVAVGDPQRSPDGQWVAYTVTTIDAEKDKRNTDIWMVKQCDLLLTYEEDTYNAQRPIAYTNWPTLDPLTHSTEPTAEEERAWRRARAARWPRHRPDRLRQRHRKFPHRARLGHRDDTRRIVHRDFPRGRRSRR